MTLLAEARRRLRRLLRPARSREELQRFWRDPSSRNRPETYLDPSAHPRSRLLVDLVRRHAPRPDRASPPPDSSGAAGATGGPERPDSPDPEAAESPRSGAGPSILELGCNAGRNLEFLLCAGFEDLSAIEINAGALELLRERHPAVAERARLVNRPLEETLPEMADGAFDVVFSMAVLEHVPDESRGLFAEIARVARAVVITIEDERHVSWRHFPRDYGRIFARLGLREVETVRCDPERHSLSDKHVARVFRKDAAGDARPGA